MIIVFCGPDGCGKTTAAEYYTQYMEAEYSVRFTPAAYRFGLLPPLKKIAATLQNLFYLSQNKEEHLAGTSFSNSTDEIRGKGMTAPVNPIKLVPSFLWNICDYVLGGFDARIRKKNIVFARYYTDNFVQRSYRKFPKILLNAFYKIIVKPNVIVLLNRDPYLIYAAKPELDIEEIKFQVDLFRNLFSGNPTFIEIDADEDFSIYIPKLCKDLVARYDFY